MQRKDSSVKLFSLQNEHGALNPENNDGAGFAKYVLDEGTVYAGCQANETIIFLLYGIMTISSKGQKIEMTTRQMIFISRNENFKIEAITDCQLIVAEFDKVISPQTKFHMSKLVKMKTGHNFRLRPLPIKSALVGFVYCMQSYLDQGIDCLPLRELKLKELFWLLRFYYSDKELVNFFYNFLGAKKEEGIRLVVMDSWRKTRNVADLAKLCSMSASTFRRHFLREFGEPIGAWLTRNLNEEIEHRLSECDSSINQIAEDLNFSSAAHFSTYCRRCFGSSPSELREVLQSTGRGLKKIL